MVRYQATEEELRLAPRFERVRSLAEKGNISSAYSLAGLYREGRGADAFERVLAIDPDFYQARAILANLKLHQRNPAAAL